MTKAVKKAKIDLPCIVKFKTSTLSFFCLSECSTSVVSCKHNKYKGERISLL